MARRARAGAKVLSLEELLRAINDRNKLGRVVFTNGCFDLLHVGHVRSFEHAAALGNVLIVGVNDDESVRALKVKGRPILPADERAELIAALDCVDFVTVFGERTAESLVAAVRPDVYVKGGDYDESSLPEAAIVRSYGGEVTLAPLFPGRSTTGLIELIRGQE